MLAAANLIRAEIKGGSLVEQAVFGTPDPDEIVRTLATLAEGAVGSPIVEASFYRSSVGCVAGLVSRSGRAVVVKAHQPDRRLDALLAIGAVQSALADKGFPCPRTLSPPARIGPILGFATFETYLPDPGQRRICPEMLAVSARGLARLASHTEGMESLGRVLDTAELPVDALYPTPHSPLFDFEATSSGAEWIDVIAAQAREVIALDRGKPHLTHGDWSAANVRFSEAELLAVYDWDSLLFAPLSRAVGVAAATWSSWGEEPEPMPPSASEVREYVREFERGWRRFSEVERRAAYANALYCLAYTARCEHSLVREGRKAHLWAGARLLEEGTALLCD